MEIKEIIQILKYDDELREEIIQWLNDEGYLDPLKFDTLLDGEF